MGLFPTYAVWTSQGTFDLVASVLEGLPFVNGPTLSAIMADVHFHNALVVCGVAFQELMDAIMVTQGVSDVAVFVAHSVKELDSLATAINKARPAEGQDPVVLNQIVLKKLKAFRLWLLWRRRRGMDYGLDEFDANELQWGLDRMAFETRFTDAEPPEQLLPERLNSIGYDVWQTFWRQLTAYCGTIRGAMGIPISYVFRAHDEPTDEMLIETYADSDEELIATVELTGPDYHHDNKMVWNILTRLVGSGACWPFIQHLVSTFDARAAIKILKTQSEGTASDSSRRARATGILEGTIYDGKSNKFSFDKFIEKLQSAFTELEETKNGISEGLKVDRMIKNITSPLLHQAIPTVMNDISLNTSFSKAAAFLSGYLAKVHGIDPTGKTSKIASTTTDSNQALGGRKYTDEEWKLLPSSEKEAIRRKRQKQKKKEKRKAAAVANGGSSEKSDEKSFKQLKAKRKKINKQIAAAAKRHGFDDSCGSDSEETVAAGNKKKKA